MLDLTGWLWWLAVGDCLITSSLSPLPKIYTSRTGGQHLFFLFSFHIQFVVSISSFETTHLIKFKVNSTNGIYSEFVLYESLNIICRRDKPVQLVLPQGKVIVIYYLHCIRIVIFQIHIAFTIPMIYYSLKNSLNYYLMNICL